MTSSLMIGSIFNFSLILAFSRFLCETDHTSCLEENINESFTWPAVKEDNVVLTSHHIRDNKHLVQAVVEVEVNDVCIVIHGLSLQEVVAHIGDALSLLSIRHLHRDSNLDYPLAELPLLILTSINISSLPLFSVNSLISTSKNISCNIYVLSCFRLLLSSFFYFSFRHLALMLQVCLLKMKTPTLLPFHTI